MIKYIRKRDGRMDEFNLAKITAAIFKSFDATDADLTVDEAKSIAEIVEEKLEERGVEMPTVELVQDTVEETLIESGYVRVAKAYILYRADRTRSRDRKSRLMRTLEEINKKENDTPVSLDKTALSTSYDTLLKYGKEAEKEFNEMFVLSEKAFNAHKSGDLYIYGRDAYTLSAETIHLDLSKLFYGGFDTKYTTLREPNSITSYADLAVVAVRLASHDVYGEISIKHFDTTMAEGVRKSFTRKYFTTLKTCLQLEGINLSVIERLKALDVKPSLTNKEYQLKEKVILSSIEGINVTRLQKYVTSLVQNQVIRDTYQAMESFLHQINLAKENIVNPISIQYGLDTTVEGRLVVKSLLEATKNGLGKGETPIYPTQIYCVKKGINATIEDVNYSIFKDTLSVDYMHYAFMDHNGNDVLTGFTSNGARLVNADRLGNLFTTAINIVRPAIESKGDKKAYYQLLDQLLEDVVSLSQERLQILQNRKMYQYPFLMKEGLWEGSELLELEDKVEDLLNKGTISITFSGLEETVYALTGYNIDASSGSGDLALEILQRIKDYLDQVSAQEGIQYVLSGVSDTYIDEHFTSSDASYYNIVPKVTDHTYTSSYHTLRNDRLFEQKAEAILTGGYAYVTDDIESLLNTSIGYAIKA